MPTAAPGYGTPQYAGFGARLGGYIIDYLISLIFFIPGFAGLFLGPHRTESCDQGRCRVPESSSIAIGTVLFVIGFVAFAVLYCKNVGKGQSWGMKAANVRVVDQNTGQPIGTGRAVGRYFARIISAFPCLLGYFWNLWDQRKQTWHDKIVGSVVVKS